MTPTTDLGTGVQRFAVTGATGWLGRAFLDVLAQTLGATALSERVTAFASQPRTISVAGTAIDVRSLADLPSHPHDVLVHLAFLTRGHVAILGVERYTAENIEITTRVLAAIQAQRPAAICYSSSGAVYGLDGGGDLTADPYAELKRLDEHALQGAAADVGARLIVARVFNVAGPWASQRGYAIVDMIMQAQAGGPLSIRARGPVRRAYMDVSDLASVLVAAACEPDGPAETVFDTSGEVVEMADLATRVVDVLKTPIAIERTWDPKAPADDYVGHPAACDELFARLGLARRSLDDQILRTAEFIATTPRTA